MVSLYAVHMPSEFNSGYLDTQAAREYILEVTKLYGYEVCAMTSHAVRYGYAMVGSAVDTTTVGRTCVGQAIGYEYHGGVLGIRPQLFL